MKADISPHLPQYCFAASPPVVEYTSTSTEAYLQSTQEWSTGLIDIANEIMHTNPMLHQALLHPPLPGKQVLNHAAPCAEQYSSGNIPFVAARVHV